MTNSFAISSANNLVKLSMGGTGIVQMATGVDTVWVQNNFLSLGSGFQSVDGPKQFRHPVTFSGALLTSGVPVKLTHAINEAGGQPLLSIFPFNNSGGPYFRLYDFSASNLIAMDVGQRQAIDNVGNVTVDWNRLILSGGGDSNYKKWRVATGMEVSGHFCVSGKTPIYSEWNGIDAGLRTLHNTSNNTTINWESGLLYGLTHYKSVDFWNGALYDWGNKLSVDWWNRNLTGGWTATELTVTTGRLGLATGNYGFTKSGVVLAAGFRSSVALASGPSGKRIEIGSGEYASHGVILVSGNGILCRLPDVTIGTYISGGGPSYVFKMTTAGTGIISGFNNDQLIDGQLQIGLSGLYKFVTLQPYGACWYIVGQN